MLAFLKSAADFSRGCAYPATRPRISATHPTTLLFANGSPLAQCDRRFSPQRIFVHCFHMLCLVIRDGPGNWPYSTHKGEGYPGRWIWTSEKTPLLPRTRVNREEAGGPLRRSLPTSLALWRGVGAEVLVRPGVGSSALGEVSHVPELIGAARRWHRLQAPA